MTRFAFIIGCILASIAAAYYAQPYVGKSSDVILIVVTVFTVFAGFLIAIITIVGDPIMIRDGSWRVAEIGRIGVVQSLALHIALFVMYLITIGFLFSGVIIEKSKTRG